jgi:hypothetical protein
MSKTRTLPKISSFAAPTEADIAAFEALSDDEKEEMIFDEIEKGFEGEGIRITAEEYFAGRARRRAARG